MLRFAWSAMACAGAVKALCGLAAWLTIEDPLWHVNAGGVVRWQQLAAALALLVCGILTWGENPVRVAWSTCWLLGAAAFSHVGLVCAGWPDPPIEAALYVAVPAALVLPLAITSRRRRLLRREHLFTLAAAALLATVAIVHLFDPPTAAATAQAAYFCALAGGAVASAAALERRPHVL